MTKNKVEVITVLCINNCMIFTNLNFDLCLCDLINTDLQMDSDSILSDVASSVSPLLCLNITGECDDENGEWLEEKVGGMRVWQLVGIVLSIILAITIMICCCIRFRIPRTKQEIEADYIRKKLTRSFRKELAKINDKEIDEMDLRRALDRVRDIFDAAETDELQIQEKKMIYEKPNKGFGTSFNSVFQGMRVRFNKEEPKELNTMI